MIRASQNRYCRRTRALFLAAGMLAIPAASESAEIEYRTKNLDIRSGPKNGPNQPPPLLVWTRTISVPEADASWLRLEFDGFNLGIASFVVLFSVNDPTAVQTLFGPQMSQWKGTSAYFDGGAVTVQLWAAPGDVGVFVDIGKAVYGAITIDGEDLGGVCCRADTRKAGTRKAVGRVMAVDSADPCTTFIVQGGALVTAGHCQTRAGLGVVELNVPDSRASGMIRHPAPRDQYAVDQTSVLFSDGDNVPDWAVFQVYPNSETLQMPITAQADFLDPTVVDDLLAFHARIYGFGKTTQGQPRYDPTTSLSLNFAAKTWTHDFVRELNNGDPEANWIITHSVAASGGTDGAPLLLDGTSQVVGIHVRGLCQRRDLFVNVATSFRNEGLMQAVANAQ